MNRARYLSSDERAFLRYAHALQGTYDKVYARFLKEPEKNLGPGSMR